MPDGALPPAAVEAMDALERMTTRLPITNEMRLRAALPALRAHWEGETLVRTVAQMTTGAVTTGGPQAIAHLPSNPVVCIPPMPYIDHGWDAASQTWAVSFPGTPDGCCWIAQGKTLSEAVHHLAKLVPECLRRYGASFAETSEELQQLRAQITALRAPTAPSGEG